MRLRVIANALLVLGLVLLADATTHAHSVPRNATTSRFLPVNCSGTSYEQHWAHSIIPVKINTSATNGVQHLQSPSGAQWGVTNFSDQVKVAINEFNANIGANVRLRFAGTTSNVWETGAIVISRNSSQSEALGTAANSIGCGGTSFPGQINASNIFLYPVQGNGLPRYFSGFETAVGVDLVVLIGHELGHAIGMSHSKSGNGPYPTLYDSKGVVYSPSSSCVMDPGPFFNHRHWTKYEKDTLRSIYGTRLSLVRPVWSGLARNYGGSWTIAPAQSLNGINVVVGPGKMSEGSGSGAFAWASSQGGPIIAGANRSGSNQYSGFFSLTPPSLTAPAVAFGGQEFRAFWVEVDQPTIQNNGATADYGQQASNGRHFSEKSIHQAVSSNGSSWTYQGPLVDPSNGQVIRIVTDDVSASFDPARMVFVVTWIDNFYNGRLMTIPTTGSAQPSNVYTSLGTKFWETPSMSCSSTSCQIVGPYHEPFHGGPVSTTPVITLVGSVSLTGVFNASNTMLDTGIFTSMRVGLTSVPFDSNSFVLSFVGSDGSSLYAVKKTAPSAAWPSPGGPLISTTAAAFSAPSAGFWANPPHVGLMVANHGP